MVRAPAYFPDPEGNHDSIDLSSSNQREIIFTATTQSGILWKQTFKNSYCMAI